MPNLASAVFTASSLCGLITASIICMAISIQCLSGFAPAAARETLAPAPGGVSILERSSAKLNGSSKLLWSQHNRPRDLVNLSRTWALPPADKVAQRQGLRFSHQKWGEGSP